MARAGSTARRRHWLRRSSLPSQVGMGGNSDVAAAAAEVAYQRSDFQACYETTAALVARDPYHLGVMPTHLAAALHCGRRNELFRRGHSLVDEYPDKVCLPAVNWKGAGWSARASGRPGSDIHPMAFPLHPRPSPGLPSAATTTAFRSTTSRGATSARPRRRCPSPPCAGHLPLFCPCVPSALF